MRFNTAFNLARRLLIVGVETDARQRQNHLPIWPLQKQKQQETTNNLGHAPKNLMFEQEDRNYVSVGSWMGMMLVTAIPIVGLIMILVWAFAGDNESRKNYFRAILSWVLILVALSVAAVLVIGWLGEGPALHRFLQEQQR